MVRPASKLAPAVLSAVTSALPMEALVTWVRTMAVAEPPTLPPVLIAPATETTLVKLSAPMVTLPFVLTIAPSAT